MKRSFFFLKIFTSLTFLTLFFVSSIFAQNEFILKRPDYDPKVFKSKKEYLWILKAYEFAKLGKELKAIELTEKAIHFHPTGSAYLWKAFFHEEAGRRMIREWVQRKTNQAKTLDREAIRRHYLSCLESYQKSLELSPNDETLHYQLGQSYLQYLNDPSKAEEHFLKAFELSPQQIKTRLALALTYLELKRYGQARQEAENLLKKQEAKVQAQAHLILGRIELEQKNFSRAAEEFSLALSLDPGTIVAHYFYSQAKQRMGQIKSAEESYRNFLKLFLPLTLNDLKLVEDSQTVLEQLQGEKKRVLRE